jgi:uroporphyrinogen decarboxylase
MRQAGRYLPGYRKIREKVDFVTLSETPDLVVQVTKEPVDRFGMDAAILFADILTPIIGAGVEVEFDPGPVIARPFRSERDLPRLANFVPVDAVPATLESVSLLKASLDVPLIGFAGAPFTLACYLVDGRGTKDFAATRSLMYRNPSFLHSLLGALADVVASYAGAQVRAGAAAIQIFDTWAGLLSAAQFGEFVLPVVRRIVTSVRELSVPVIYYVNGCSHLLGQMGRTGADVAGVDWRIPLDEARAALPTDMAVQGNLDPLVLLGSPREISEHVREVLRRAGDRPGHIFNLGHGIHRTTPPENVEVLVDTIREESAR